MQPWGADRLWPPSLLILLTAALLVLPARLEAHRDLGSGLLPERAVAVGLRPGMQHRSAWRCGSGAVPSEASGIIEPQPAGALSRTRLAIRRLLIPVIGSAVLLALGGGVMRVGYGAIIGDPSQAGRLALSALVYWPAVMVFVGIAIALFGCCRDWRPADMGGTGSDVVHRPHR